MTLAAKKPAIHPHRGLIRGALVLGVCVLAALLLSLDSVYSLLKQGLAALDPLIAAHPILGALVFTLLSALAAVMAFFSSAIMVPSAVMAWGKAATVVLLWIGWLIGGLSMYALGRSLRHPREQGTRPSGRIAAYLPSSPQDLKLPLVLLWQLALPSEIPGYLCGYLGVPFRTYFLALALGELPFALGAVLLGESVVDRKLGLLLAIGAVAATFAYFVFRALHRRMPASGS